MDYQDIFSKAYIAILNQGVPSMTGMACQYRGPNGTSCAIGHLLPADLRATVPEGSITYLLQQSQGTREFFGYANLRDVNDNSGRTEFLQNLQSAHDFAALPENISGDDFDAGVPHFDVDVSLDFLPSFKNNMRQIAEFYGLTVPEV